MRRTVVIGIAAGVILSVTGCSSDEASESAPSSTETAEQAPDTDEEEWEFADEPEPAQRPEPIGVGESATWTAVDSYSGDETTMSVTVDAVDYIGESAEDDTSGPPEHGQYVRLTLTVANVGELDGAFAPFGMISWENDTTPAMDVSTLTFPDGPGLDTTYRPGQGQTGRVILDVPERGGVVTYWDDPMGTSGFAVELPE